MSQPPLYLRPEESKQAIISRAGKTNLPIGYGWPHQVTVYTFHHPFVVTIVFFQPQIASRAAHLWHIHDPSLLLIEYQFLILVLTSSEMQARRVQCTKLIRRLNPRFSIFSLEFAHFVPSNCGTLGD